MILILHSSPRIPISRCYQSILKTSLIYGSHVQLKNSLITWALNSRSPCSVLVQLFCLWQKAMWFQMGVFCLSRMEPIKLQSSAWRSGILYRISLYASSSSSSRLSLRMLGWSHLPSRMRTRLSPLVCYDLTSWMEWSLAVRPEVSILSLCLNDMY